jgi:hypothetical protein
MSVLIFMHLAHSCLLDRLAAVPQIWHIPLIFVSYLLVITSSTGPGCKNLDKCYALYLCLGCDHRRVFYLFRPCRLFLVDLT